MAVRISTKRGARTFTSDKVEVRIERDTGRRPVLQLRLPTVASKKNETTQHYSAGRVRVGKGKRVEQQENAIAIAVQVAIGFGTLLFSELEDLSMQVVWLWDIEMLQVTVQSLGIRPELEGGRTGRRRDLANQLCLLLDALQGCAYANDSQVARITMAKETSDRARPELWRALAAIPTEETER